MNTAQQTFDIGYLLTQGNRDPIVRSILPSHYVQLDFESLLQFDGGVQLNREVCESLISRLKDKPVDLAILLGGVRMRLLDASSLQLLLTRLSKLFNVKTITFRIGALMFAKENTRSWQMLTQFAAAVQSLGFNTRFDSRGNSPQAPTMESITLESLVEALNRLAEHFDSGIELDLVDYFQVCKQSPVPLKAGLRLMSPLVTSAHFDLGQIDGLTAPDARLLWDKLKSFLYVLPNLGTVTLSPPTLDGSHFELLNRVHSKLSSIKVESAIMQNLVLTRAV